MDSDVKDTKGTKRGFFCITSLQISCILTRQIIFQIWSGGGVCARLNKANLFKGWSSGWGTPQSYIHYICDFTLLTGALSCGRFHLCVWWWLREKAGIVLCGLQACSQLRRVSQWRVGGRLNVRRTWPRSHSLMQPCVWPLSLSPSDSVCLYPSVSSFSLCLRCTRHLVWLHICGYSVYKARTAAPFVQ